MNLNELKRMNIKDLTQYPELVFIDKYENLIVFATVGLFWAIGGIWAVTGLLSIVVIGLLLIPFAVIATFVLLLMPLVSLVYGVIGAIQTSQGEDFRYWLVGDWVRGELTRP